MAKQPQITSSISIATQERLKHFTQHRGLKKNWVVERALIQFMDSRRDLPEDMITPTQVVLEDQAFDALVAHLDKASPTQALKELFHDDKHP